MNRTERKEAYRNKVNETAAFVLAKIFTEFNRVRNLDYTKGQTDEQISKVAIEYGNGLLNTMIKSKPQEKQLILDAARVIKKKLTEKP